jgi:hypothetical protein
MATGLKGEEKNRKLKRGVVQKREKITQELST